MREPIIRARPVPAIGGGHQGTAVARRAVGAAVPAGDTTTHGQWVANVTQVLQALEFIRRLQEAMLAGLTAANASRTQIADVKRWSDNLTTRRAYIHDWLRKIDSRLSPLIDAVELAGGVEEVADASYHADY